MSRATVLLTALALVLVGALWWLFLYSPGQDELALVEQEIAAAEQEASSLRQRVERLETVRAEAPEIEAAIARLQGILPDDADLPGALRQIAAAAEDAGLDVESLTTGRPLLQDEAIGLYAAPIALAGEGSYFQIVDFLRRLEDPSITARGLTFNDVNLTVREYPDLTVTVSGEMYATLTPPPSPEAEEETVPAESDDADADADTEAEGDDA